MNTSEGGETGGKTNNMRSAGASADTINLRYVYILV